jgi:uncharacterized membrane protein
MWHWPSLINLKTSRFSHEITDEKTLRSRADLTKNYTETQIALMQSRTVSKSLFCPSVFVFSASIPPFIWLVESTLERATIHN